MRLSLVLLAILSFEFLIYWAALTVFLPSDWSFWFRLLAIALFAALWRVLSVLITMLLSRAFSKLSLLGRLRLFAAESCIVLWLYSWAQPVLWWWLRRAQAKQNRGDGVVLVLIHGFVCNAGMWGKMCRHLRAKGFSRVHTVDLDPFYLSMQHSLAEFKSKLTAILERYDAKEAILIGHSMGGVLARVFQYHHPELVHAAISIGAPHAGTDLARLVSSIEKGPLRPDSAWLAQFTAALAAERAEKYRVESGKSLFSLNIWSDSDNIVFPQGNAQLTGVEEVKLNGLGHLELAFAPSCLNVVSTFALAQKLRIEVH